MELISNSGPTNLEKLVNLMKTGVDCDRGLNIIDEGLSDCNLNCQIAAMPVSTIFASLFTTDASGALALRVYIQDEATDSDRCGQPLKRPKDNCDWESAFYNFLGMSANSVASGVLTLSANLSDGDTITIGSRTYTAQTVLTDVDGNFLIGATASDTIDNLIAAITLGAGAGVTYAASTTANAEVTASAGAGDTMDVDSLVSSATANSIVTTETSATASFAAATLLGGITAKPTLILTQSI